MSAQSFANAAVLVFCSGRNSPDTGKCASNLATCHAIDRTTCEDLGEPHAYLEPATGGALQTLVGWRQRRRLEAALPHAQLLSERQREPRHGQLARVRPLFRRRPSKWHPLPPRTDVFCLALLRCLIYGLWLGLSCLYWRLLRLRRCVLSGLCALVRWLR